MASIGTDEAGFIAQLSRDTGIDPRVLVAWVQQEGAYASNGTGGFNYFNLRVGPGGKGYSGVSEGRSPAGFAQFGTPADAETETAYWLNKFSNYAGIRAVTATKPTPRQEIAAIAASKWDKDHYGGPGGPNLLNTFNSLFAGGADTSYQSPSTAGGVVGQAGTGSAADGGSVDLGTAPVTGSISDAGHAVAGSIGSVEDALKFVLSVRFLEIIGGGLLVLVGLVALMREVGINVPNPIAATPIGKAVDGPISAQPRSVQKRAGFTPATDASDRRAARAARSGGGGQTDEIPF